MNAKTLKHGEETRDERRESRGRGPSSVAFRSLVSRLSSLPSIRLGVHILFATAAALLTGCAVAHVDRPVAADLGANDADAQIDFWHTLALKPVACNDDAFHGLLLDLDGEDKSTTYEGRVADLKSRKMLPQNFNRPATEAITRGTLAYALVRELHIKGGVIMTVFGPSDRYAVRELRYLDLYPTNSSPNQTFSGTEFVGVIGRVEDYQSGNPADLPASVMPEEAPNARANPVVQPPPPNENPGDARRGPALAQPGNGTSEPPAAQPGQH